MNPYVMTLLLSAGWGFFSWQMLRRWRLMRLGPGENRFDRIGERLRRTWKYAFVQKRMRRYWWAGAAHGVIFVGFGVLILRSVMLFGRGYSTDFDFWGILAEGSTLGDGYSFVKDGVAVMVILATLVFFYYRVVKKLPRMTLSFEGLLILMIIEVMMWADLLHDGAIIASGAESAGFIRHAPAGSILAMGLSGLGDGVLGVLSHLGFWTHVGLVLLFLNLLPASKHFHVITAIPNVFTQNLAPRGRLSAEDVEGKIEREETLGLARIDQLSWKGVLDLYTCTECGRCTDFCPASNTGKLLSPKQLTLDLRNYLYEHEKSLTSGRADNEGGDGESGAKAVDDLVPQFIKPEVLWACTTCGACETECPVFITFVDKIVDMRRHLVMEKAEFPAELQNAFRGLETNANPWNFPAADRAGWTSGLDVPLVSENPDAEILFWVGCSPSFDDRARKIARATASLLKAAGVNFAILGQEEQCTGDPARRAGNEFLFQMLAKANVETLNNHKVRKIVTTCPHCFNTLLNEYPDFGGKYEVVHHADFLSELVRSGRLKPTHRIDARVVYHDSCYLGRYNDIYDSPRDTLRSIPGLTVLEPAETRDRGMCCGAGGAQMFKEEEAGSERVNKKRTEQLLAVKPDAVASACPFCQRMLVDGLAGEGREDVGQFDIAELLWQSIEGTASSKPV
ncbi:MAG: (Fe-S)-binding protein [Planctomycetota bacterium]|nr:(Fe-S)-binding protein [Planctomycetota bacterium]